MPLPIRYGGIEPAWYDRRMPTLEDFDGDEAAYDAALSAYITQQNGGAAFAPPTETPFTLQDGSTGVWRTAGSNRTGADGKPISVGEQAANRVNNYLTNPSFSVGYGGTGQVLQLANQNNPGLLESAYGAMDAQGDPLLPDAALAYMEQVLGMTPGDAANWAPPVAEAPAPDTGADPTVNYPYGPATQGPDDFAPGGFYAIEDPQNAPYGPATQGPDDFGPGGFYDFAPQAPDDLSGMDGTNPANPVQDAEGAPRQLMAMQPGPAEVEIAQVTGIDPGVIARIRAQRGRGQFHMMPDGSLMAGPPMIGGY